MNATSHFDAVRFLKNEVAVKHLTRVLDVNILENHLNPVLFVGLQAVEETVLRIHFSGLISRS